MERISNNLSAFTPARLLAQLTHYPAPRYWVAYSGGLDSHTLLHAMAGLRPHLPGTELHAIHINHALQPDAQQWADHCAEVCAALQIPYRAVHVNATPAAGESPEAAARSARYEALAGVMNNGDALLTAHHRDDQAETLLLQLLRGSGPHGLAAMPACATFAAGVHLRPLLEFTRAQLHHYAIRQNLSWIEDQSNFVINYDRNYLRQEIMPRLAARWPAVSGTFARSARHAADAAYLLDVLAHSDLEHVAAERRDALSVARLKMLTQPRQRNLLHAWFKHLHLPLPAAVHIEHILSDVVAVAADRVPCVRWPGAEVRRYRDLMYALTPLTPHDSSAVLPWNMQDTLTLPGGLGMLSAMPATGSGIKQWLCRNPEVTVRFRQGGECCRPAGRGHTHELRKLFQETAIPPWQRDRIPLIYAGPDLAAVGDLWVCEPFQAAADENGLVIVQQA
ncbi:MAG: tRNA lysidine(34) synthetase TilS [Gammaproteobacteria bacterium]|nr:tRNA lysidine(34) synthetase TilS [Gammaproteobacteria bacterium]